LSSVLHKLAPSPTASLSALLCPSLHYCVPLCITVSLSALLCPSLHYCVLLCITGSLSALRCPSLHYCVPLCITVSFSASLLSPLHVFPPLSSLLLLLYFSSSLLLPPTYALHSYVIYMLSPVSCRLSRGTLLTTSFIVLSRSSARGTFSYGSSSAVSMAVRCVGRIQSPN